jgi:glucose-1-phosphate cytidylyltransferase
VVEGDEVRRFAEKPQAEEGRINGGFFVFDKRVLQRLSTDPSCILEREPLEQLAADGELRVFEHDGFWQCADTLRDVELLRGLWDSGNAPWRVWDDRIGAAGANRGRRSLDRDEAPREPLAEAS